MTTEDNPNAFPFSAEYGHPAACGGMTLRDWFAGQALAGMCASEYGERLKPVNAANDAYLAADAMLAARKGGPHD